jgi:glycosyltransferase involved in cell wall biosynthesis
MISSDMKLSIIIPFYNVEEWISDCLNSLIPINDEKIEIILVNDGSTDNTRAIAETYRHLFLNFLIHDQANGGLSRGRNVGLKMAKGEYVYFIDSDDYILPKEFIHFFNKASELQVDIAIGNGRHLIENRLEGFLKKSKINKKIGLVDGPRFYLLTNSKDEFHIGVWSRLYKKSFLDKHLLEFLPGVIHEDEEWSPKVFSLAEKVVYLDNYFYVYRHRLGSITKNKKHKYMNPKSISCFFEIINSLKSFLIEKTPSRKQKKVVLHSVHKCLMEILKREFYFTKKKLPDMKLTDHQENQLKILAREMDFSLLQRISIYRMILKIRLAGLFS